MELLIVVVVALALAAVFGVPIHIILYIALGIVELISALSLLLFIVSICLLLFSKRIDASFVDIEKADHGMYYALYKVNGEVCRCLFPTDAFLKKLLYRKTDVTIRMVKIGNWKRVIDRCTIITIVLGLILFTIVELFVGVVMIAL